MGPEQETTGDSEIDALLNTTDKSSGDGAAGGAGGGGTNAPVLVKIGDREISVDKITEWEKGYLRQSDYTKKTQELSSLRENVQNLIDVQEHLKKYPAKWDRIKTILDEQEAIKQEQNANNSQIPAEFSEKFKEIDDIKLDMQIGKVKSKYPDFNETRVIKYAAINDLDNLEEAYLKLKKEDEQIYQDTRKKVLEELKKQGESKTGKFTGGVIGSPKKVDIKNKDYNQLAEDALKDLG